MLREIRGNVMSTNSGTTFMTSFNELYYTFSPTVSDWERQSPAFKELVKITITPLLSTLSMLNYANIDSEQEMLGYGIGIILLNAAIYFAAPAIVILAIKQRRI
jgi:peptidyl-prolyl cis-trans isomerase B (cyclophilin B)